MSGHEYWPDLPRGWELYPLKRIAQLNACTLSEETAPHMRIRYVDIGNVQQGRMSAPEAVTFGDAPSRARRIVRPGDVIVSTVRTYLKAVALIEGDTDDLIVSTGFAVLSPFQHIHSRFLWYAAQSEPFVAEVMAHSDGVSYPAIPPERLGTLKVPTLPFAAQERIADFLDRETAKIDALIVKKEQFLRLVTEQRGSVAERLLIAGLDSHTSGGSDSGIEWLGKTPAHWDVRRCRLVFTERDDRRGGTVDELLTVSHITGVTSRSEKPEVNMFLAESFDDYKRCSAGDLVVNTMWAWMGALGFAKQDGIVSPSYNVYTFRSQNYEPAYYDWLFRTAAFKAEITRWSKGVWSSRLRLYPDQFFEIRIPTPPISEQRAIVSAIKAATARFERLIAPARKAVAHLREYRSALITAAVTGQIDVRDRVA